MSFVKKPRSIHGARPRPRPGSPPAAHVPTLVRAVVLAVFVVMGAAWALLHHCSFVPPPMLVPAQPTAAPTYDIEAGELPVPETIGPDAN